VNFSQRSQSFWRWAEQSRTFSLRRGKHCVCVAPFRQQPEPDGSGKLTMRLSHDIRKVTNSGGGALLDLHAGRMFRLNTTGASIVELLAKGYTEGRIAAEISQRSGIDSGLVCSDVHAFLIALKEHGLVMDDDPK
jgi:hypothetical protein